MIVELFSKRLKQNQVIDDVYEYDNIPEKLRNQIVLIWKETIGSNREIWEWVEGVMKKELGVLSISNSRRYPEDACIDFLLNHKICEEVIDIIELSFRLIDKLIRDQRYNGNFCGIKQSPDEAINELNYRFKENSVGYEYVDGQIIRIDNTFTHKEIVKPAIKLLYEENFVGVSDEFFKAHEYYRKKEYKDAILYAGKSFESIMKTICENMKYDYNKDKDTASKLISILCNEHFIPTELKNHFDGLDKVLTGLKMSLESGLPTLRNKKSGHGQGEDITYVSEQLVVYALNLSATNIVLLANLYKEHK